MTQSRFAELLDLAGDWTPPVFPLPGRDVVALGMPPGERGGRLLAAVRDCWEAGDHAVCLARLKRSSLSRPTDAAKGLAAVGRR